MTGFVLGMLAGGWALVVAFVCRRWVDARRRRPVLDMCEVCGAPATYELGEPSFNPATGEGSGMIASYCRRHRPKDAVRVR